MPIDLRSDTITQPTQAMRAVMAAAPVGDDVFGDDPTVKLLETRVAELLGKEAALFAPSGTMANQLALRALADSGDEILIDANAHIYYYEAGGPAALSGISCRCLPGIRGIFTAADLQAALRPPDQHFPPSKLVCVENTHNRGGGSIWPLHQLREIETVSRPHGLKLHLDGARLWNATSATGIPEHEYAAPFDTVSVCFSKGLGAPVGSALCGPRDIIQRARRFRKMLGGGMRQSGILAAAALHALDHHRTRLTDDHANARALADGLASLPGITIDPTSVATNIVLFNVTPGTAPQFVSTLDAAGVRMLPFGPDTIRAVTNLMVTADDIAAALHIISTTLESSR
jgi:threonine aldolase